MNYAGDLLEHYMAPIIEKTDPRAVEVCVNRPNEVWVMAHGRWERYGIPLSYEDAYDLALMAGSLSEQDVGERNPLVGGDTPDGSRVQAVIPPCVPAGTVSLTFRRHSNSVAVVSAIGSRYDTSRWNKWGRRNDARNKRNAAILQAYDAGNIEFFLQEAVQLRLNLLMTGKTGSGKTTALKTVLTLVDPQERIISIEKPLELAFPNQPNNVRLLPSHGDQGTAHVTQQQLLHACLRMRADRVLVGELRDEEAAYTYAEEACTGHSGSASSIHGGSAAEGVQRLYHLIKGSDKGRHLDKDAVTQKISQAVDIVIPFEEVGGKHVIGEVWLKPDAARRQKTIAELLE